MEPRDLAGLRLGVFGKGGAGKSTVTVFLARALQSLGYSVLVLDADSTNLGLASALGADRDPAPLLEYFGGMVFSGGMVTCPVDDPTPLAGAELWLEDLPRRYVGRTAAGVHVLSAGKLGALGPGAGCDGPVAKIARDLRVSGHGPNPVMLVDYKAGFEDAARGALTTLDWVIVVVDPTTAALQLARHMAGMVAEIRRGVPPATRHLDSSVLIEMATRLFREARIRGVLSVLNRVPTPGTEAYLRTALKGSGARVVGVFDEDAAIAEQWLRGAILESDALSGRGRALAGRLESFVRGATAPAGA
ncbi:MAG: P-loop NTPase [Gemmatimonadota bacterium]|jgi:CO dehydrogenase nickel-insertion accessory protein CooC1